MGKGDQKSRKGKINAGSYGKRRAKKPTSVGQIPVKVLDDTQKEAPKAQVRKKVGEPTEQSQNLDLKPEKPGAKTKKTEE